jgi:hypothetical protein
MEKLSTAAHRSFVRLEHGVLRAIVVFAGLTLVAAGVLLGLSILLLPVGIAFACAGIALTIWGALGNLESEGAAPNDDVLLRTPWDCRWTVTAAGKHLCTRATSAPREVTIRECATCQFWERVSTTQSAAL